MSEFLQKLEKRLLQWDTFPRSGMDRFSDKVGYLKETTGNTFILLDTEPSPEIFREHTKHVRELVALIGGAENTYHRQYIMTSPTWSVESEFIESIYELKPSLCELKNIYHYIVDSRHTGEFLTLLKTKEEIKTIFEIGVDYQFLTDRQVSFSDICQVFIQHKSSLLFFQNLRDLNYRNPHENLTFDFKELTELFTQHFKNSTGLEYVTDMAPVLTQAIQHSSHSELMNFVEHCLVKFQGGSPEINEDRHLCTLKFKSHEMIENYFMKNTDECSLIWTSLVHNLKHYKKELGIANFYYQTPTNEPYSLVLESDSQRPVQKETVRSIIYHTLEQYSLNRHDSAQKRTFLEELQNNPKFLDQTIFYHLLNDSVEQKTDKASRLKI